MEGWLFRCAVWWCIFFFTGNLQSQDRLHSHFNVRNGLPSNKAYSIAQSAAGYIWIGTDRGVVRWDGRNFKTYTTADGLPDNEVLHVFDDDYGRIWINCFNTAPAYIRDGMVYTLRNDPFLARFNSVNLYQSSYLVEKNQHWFSYTNGKGQIELVRTDNAERYVFKNPENNDGLRIIDIRKNEKGKTILVSAGNSTALERQGDRVRFKNLKNPADQSNYLINEWSAFTYKKAYYATTADGLLLQYTLQGDSPVLSTSTQLPIIPQSFFFRSGKPFFYDNKGRVYDMELGVLSAEFRFLEKHSINSLMFDQAGSLWVTTVNDGVYFYPTHGLDVYNELPFNDINSLSYFRNYIVAGTEMNGLLVMDKNYRLIRHYPEVKRVLRVVSTVNYCAVASDGAFCFLNADLRLQEMPEYVIIKDVEAIGGDTVLIGTYRNAARISLGDLQHEIIWNNRTTAVWSDVNGKVWLGTLKGIFVKHPDGSVHQVQRPAELKNARITDVREDQQGRMLIATHQEGLVVMHTDRWRIVRRSAGDKRYALNENHCEQILPLRNHIWLQGSRSLNRIRFVPGGVDIEENIVVNASNGLIAYSLFDIAANDDEMVTAVSDEGLVRILPRQLPRPVDLQIDIEWVNVNGQRKKPEALLSLANNENSIDVYFNAVCLLGGEQIQYEYRMTGLQETWVSTSGNSISYSDLPPGKYRFEIRAINPNTGVVSDVRSLQIHINPAWHHLWWVRLLGGLLLLGMIGLLVFLRIRKTENNVRLRNLENRRLAELELQAMRSRMNPHFVFNVLTAIQNFITQGREKEANFYTSRFAQLIRQNFHVSARNFTTLETEINMLNTYLELERMRFEDRMDYKIECDPLIDTDYTEIPSMLIQPFVENAVNHGIRPLQDRKGQVTVKLMPMEGERLHISIEDNGIGISAANRDKRNNTFRQSHRSEGLELTRNRIHTMNRYYGIRISIKITDLAHEGLQGTRVELEIPLNIPAV
jgi:signal transduction histidine kinase